MYGPFGGAERILLPGEVPGREPVKEWMEMTSQGIAFVLNVLLIVGGLLMLYNLYFCVLAVVGLRGRKEHPRAMPATRFAVVVAARNEEKVLAQLLESLWQQNYPRELFTVYVAPNNCTDNTRALALKCGATVFDAVGEVHGKGDVLAQMAAYLEERGGYDALCVFDADNLVHPDFLQKMNDAYAAGVRVAQGFRDSKNPTDTAVATCYSVCYWMLNRFYNAGREAFHLSGLVNGSGFMVARAVLQKLGGWNTCTMTEDYEFSAQCVLAGERVQYVAGAVIYDEQPLTFRQSWRQRRRWSSGSAQGMQLYGMPLVAQALKKRSWKCFDMALTFLTPVVQVVSLCTGVLTVLLAAYRVIEWRWMPLTEFLWLAVALVCGAFVLCAMMASFVIWLNRGTELQGSGRGVLYFALFLLSWLPISIISLFKRIRTWEPIAHTRAARLQDMTSR